MANLEEGIIKLIDLGYSKKKDDKYVKDKKYDCVNECDIYGYRYLKLVFYYLLGTDISEEKQPSL